MVETLILLKEDIVESYITKNMRNVLNFVFLL